MRQKFNMFKYNPFTANLEYICISGEIIDLDNVLIADHTIGGLIVPLICIDNDGNIITT